MDQVIAEIHAHDAPKKPDLAWMLTVLQTTDLAFVALCLSEDLGDLLSSCKTDVWKGKKYSGKSVLLPPSCGDLFLCLGRETVRLAAHNRFFTAHPLNFSPFWWWPSGKGVPQLKHRT